MPLELPKHSPADITRILAEGGYGRKRPSKNSYMVRTELGILVKMPGKPPSTTIGKYEGKVGTKTRSRKGAVRTKPNGSRYYVRGDNPEVVYY